jgi:tetratricopeptide (TPR) repeat protein
MARQTRSGRFGPPGSSNPGSGVRPAQRGVFRKEGEYWALGYGGKAFRLKETKGLGYLAHLLRHPAVEFHVLDLVGGIASRQEGDKTTQSIQGLPQRAEDLEKAGIHVTTLGDAGEMLDEQAKAAYRRRLSELREELDEAKEFGNVERAEQAEQEIDALSKELARAVGLGGRSRRAASASERARQTVAKTIKATVERVAQSDAALADILSRCIRTGNFCSYQPDPDFPIAWEFAATGAASTIEPAERPTSSRDAAAKQPNLPQSSPAVLEVSPFSFAERTTFVGRETERAAIRAVINRALNGHGTVVMLGGGPGVGKTRLAMEMAEYASQVGFRYSIGRCYEREESFPYLPFVEILESNLARAASLDDYRRQMGDNAAELAQLAPSLRRVFRDIPQPLELPPVQQRHYLFQSVADALGRWARICPHFLVLDDLQWADESTLGLLTHLSNRIARLPLMIIGTYRDLDNNPVLVRTLEELIRSGIHQYKLGGLSKDAVAWMLSGLSQQQLPESLVSLIFEESQGNPFFVEEVYRHLIEDGKVFDAAGQFRTDIKIEEIDVPENVRLIIGRRLARLDDNEKRVLAAAAVIGRSFSFQLLTETSRIDVDELFPVLEKAQQMGIIVPGSEGPEQPFTFAHELVRQTLLADISAPRRQKLHASVADGIERLYPHALNERSGEVADHLIKAASFADERRLVHYLTLAGKNAIEAAAFEEAGRSFRSALSHQDAADVREKADLLANLAMAERGLDQWEAAIGHLREVLEIYINLDDRKMIGRSFTGLAAASIWAGRFREATETARRGLTYLQAEVSADRARLFATLAQALAAAGVCQAADEALDEALNIASRLSAPKLEARLLGVRPIINIQFFRLRETVTDRLLSKQLGGPDLPPWQFVLQLLILHQTLLYLGRLEEAVRIADELEPLARKIGQALSVGFCLSTRAWIDFGKNPDLAKLEAGLHRVRESDREPSFAHLEVLSDVQVGLVDFFRGNWTRALVHAEASRRAEAGSCMEGFGVGTIFRQLTYTGSRDDALAILDEKRALLPRRGQTNTAGSWLMLALVIEGLIMLGQYSQAGPLYSLVCELIDSGPVVLWPIFRFTHTVAGMAAAAAAHAWEAAEDHFQTALRQAESFPYRLEQAEIRRFHAMMLMARAGPGDREKAYELLCEASKTYTHIGMSRHIELTHTLLEQAAGA